MQDGDLETFLWDAFSNPKIIRYVLLKWRRKHGIFCQSVSELYSMFFDVIFVKPIMCTLRLTQDRQVILTHSDKGFELDVDVLPDALQARLRECILNRIDASPPHIVCTDSFAEISLSSTARGNNHPLFTHDGLRAFQSQWPVFDPFVFLAYFIEIELFLSRTRPQSQASLAEFLIISLSNRTEIISRAIKDGTHFTQPHFAVLSAYTRWLQTALMHSGTLLHNTAIGDIAPVLIRHAAETRCPGVTAEKDTNTN